MKQKQTALFLLTLLSLSLSFSASAISLNGRWTLDFWKQGKTPVTSPGQMRGISYETIDATVPGNVELDLLSAGIIPPPELGSNVYLLRQWEAYQWRYTKTFDTPQHEQNDELFLTFGGIDCYADIFVNGNKVGEADNMLIEHSYDVTTALSPIGEINLIEVYTRSTVEEGRKHIIQPISLNFAQPESVYSRRAPHTYGWDIMPRLVSAGLWRDVELEIKHPIHIKDVNCLTLSVDVPNKRASMRLDYNISLPVESSEKVLVSYTLSRNGKEKFHNSSIAVAHAGSLRFDLTDVEFWWPRGYGEATLYDAEFSICDLNGRELDKCTQKVGIRTIKLNYTDIHSEAEPGNFCFIVNGEPIYIKGSNWTPMDALHSRDPLWLEKTVKIAEDLNCNMLRCWGGNVYESDRFYDLCDEKGIMIWQDFSMGCTFYSQLLDFQTKIEEEIYSVVMRLRRHPSIALWAGNNEDDQTLTIGTLAPFKIDPNKDVVSRETIPHVLFELDPSRTYLPSSPYWSEKLVSTSYSTANLPEDHIWGPRGYYKDSFYTNISCIFVSEIGYHGMPNRESIEKMFPKESVYPWTDRKSFHWNEDWLTKSVRIYKGLGYTPDRNNLMINQVRSLFDEVPADLDRFIFASQAVQAEALKYFIEKFRGHKFSPCTGMLWWNIRDGWPIISDAVVDWYFSPKLSFDFIQHAQYNVCALINDAENGSYPLVIVNDTFESASGEVEVKDIDSGNIVYQGNYSLGSNSKEIIARIPERSGQGMFLISYTSPEGKHFNHYLYGKAPYNMDNYKSWLVKSKIYKIK